MEKPFIVFVTSKAQTERFVDKRQINNFGTLFCWKQRLKESENWIAFFFKPKITLKHLKILRSFDQRISLSISNKCRTPTKHKVSVSSPDKFKCNRIDHFFNFVSHIFNIDPLQNFPIEQLAKKKPLAHPRKYLVYGHKEIYFSQSSGKTMRKPFSFLQPLNQCAEFSYINPFMMEVQII